MRAWTEKVLAYPALDGKRGYGMLVTAVEKSRSPRGIRVELTHVSDEQGGRAHTVLLPLPIRPGSLAAKFFAAIGCDIVVGRSIRPKQAVGRRVVARFSQSPAEGEWTVTAFEPAGEKPTDPGSTASDAPTA